MDSVVLELNKIKMKTKNKFDFNYILIQPAKVSTISSRKDINPFYDGFLPLITAPMDTVVSEKNNSLFTLLNVRTCLPRGEKNELGFISYSLDEIEKIVVKEILENARENQNTTTNQLNKLLGTEKKEFKIQNNIRSEVIMNINKKFKLFSNINDDLIERERAELDKRFMEYNINKLYLKKISTKMF